MSNISNIGNLRFFTEKGHEITMQKDYTIKWEIIPHDVVSSNFIVNPSGHFFVNSNNAIECIVDNPGLILNKEIKYTDINGNTITINSLSKSSLPSGYSDIYNNFSTLFFRYYYEVERNNYNKSSNTKSEHDLYNTVKLTIKAKDLLIEEEINALYVFEANNIILSSLDQTSIYTGNLGSSTTYNSTSGSYYYTLYGITSGILNPNSRLIDIFNAIVGDIRKLYPYVTYQGVVKQDKISENFVAASTIIVYQNDYNEDHKTLQRPSLIDENNKEYNIHFEFLKDSEMRFISTNTEAEIIWEDHYDSDISRNNSILTLNGNEPIHFSVGFLAETEGTYQNVMTMFLEEKNASKITRKYFIGYINFLTEVEGEDERFRALLTNFGIPDPIKYPNIFKESEVYEELPDWKIVNKKSKELMLYYDLIFPYVGTYKALMNALKFLGYSDIVFKEWYKIKDQNDRDRYALIQLYDFTTGENLLSKLKRYNVTYGEFERYRKLNRLTMIYHLNDIDYESGELLDIDINTTTGYFTSKPNYSPNVTTSVENGLYKSASWKTMPNQLIDIPTTYNIYEYRTDEILAKLYSVKQWLEKYILGVNCYISDICGEYIVLERIKNLAYVTEHTLQDFYTEGHFTPKITNISEFKNSSANITCSLNEFTCLRIEDYKDIPISAFIRKKETCNGIDVYISNPLDALVVADEIQYELHLDDASFGSLVEFTANNSSTNPVYLHEGELLLWNETNPKSEFDSTESPIITITKGNIRYDRGDWKNNIAVSIYPIVDISTGNTRYKITTETGTYIINQKPSLKSLIEINAKTKESNNTGTLCYDTSNNYNLPMFMINKFCFYNVPEILLNTTENYIVEIIEGLMSFRNKWSDIDDGTLSDNKCIGATLVFSETDELDFVVEEGEQYICIDYEYNSNRMPIYTIDLPSNTLLSPIKKYMISEQQFKEGLDISIGHQLSYNDYSSFMSGDLHQEYSLYSTKFLQKTEEYSKVNELLRFFERHTIENTLVTIPVNRLGEYSITVKAYDYYNNIYVNKSDDIWKVSTKPIDIFNVINQENSNNKVDFYKNNINGEKLSSSKIQPILDRTEIFPKFPLKYRIPEFEYVDDVQLIKYDSLSYALDTPKLNDYLILTNLTEKIISMEPAPGGYSLLMSSANSKRQNIYRNDARVTICAYDVVSHKIYKNYLDFTVESCNESAGTLTISGKEIIDNGVISSINKEYELYVINSILIDLDESKVTIKEDTKETIIIDDSSYQSFNVDDVIKIQYIFNSTIINETAYRIKDIITEGTSTKYTLDGIIDLKKLDNNLYHNVNTVKLTSVSEKEPIYRVDDSDKKIIIKLSALHMSGVQYVLRVNSNAFETSEFNDNTYALTTSFNYTQKPLLFKNYMDDTYTGYVYDYDSIDLYNIWYNAKKAYIASEDNLYLYKNYPVTIDKGLGMILYADEDLTILTNSYGDNIEVPYKREWICRNYGVDEVLNWESHENVVEKETLFRSINHFLTVAPDMNGPYQFKLNAIDIYGNLVVNEGEGLVYIEDSGKILKKRYSMFDSEGDDNSEIGNISVKEIKILDAYQHISISNEAQNIKYKDYIRVIYQIRYSNGKNKTYSNANNVDGIKINYTTQDNKDNENITENTRLSTRNLQDPVKVKVIYMETLDDYTNVTLVQNGSKEIKSIIIRTDDKFVACTEGTIDINSIKDYKIYYLYSDDSASEYSGEISLIIKDSNGSEVQRLEYGNNFYESLNIVGSYTVSVTYDGKTYTGNGNIIQDPGTIVEVNFIPAKISGITISNSVPFEGQDNYIPTLSLPSGTTLTNIANVNYKENYSSLDYSLQYSWNQVDWTNTITPKNIPANNVEESLTYTLYIRAYSNVNTYIISEPISFLIIQGSYEPVMTYTINWTKFQTNGLVEFDYNEKGESVAKSTDFIINAEIETFKDGKSYSKVNATQEEIYGILSNSKNSISITGGSYNSDFNASVQYDDTSKKVQYKIYPLNENNKTGNQETYKNYRIGYLEPLNYLTKTTSNVYQYNFSEGNKLLSFKVFADSYVQPIVITGNVDYSLSRNGSSTYNSKTYTWNMENDLETDNSIILNNQNDNEQLKEGNINITPTLNNTLLILQYKKISFTSTNSNIVGYINENTLKFDETKQYWTIPFNWNSQPEFTKTNNNILGYDNIELSKDNGHSTVYTNYLPSNDLVTAVTLKGIATYGYVEGSSTEGLYGEAGDINIYIAGCTPNNAKSVEVNRKLSRSSDKIYITGAAGELSAALSNTKDFEFITTSFTYENTGKYYFIKEKAKTKNNTDSEKTSNVNIKYKSKEEVDFTITQGKDESEVYSLILKQLNGETSNVINKDIIVESPNSVEITAWIEKRNSKGELKSEEQVSFDKK